MISTKQRNVALLVAGCFFMENLDGTIVTTAAPRIGRDLHVSSTSVGLVITAYLITLAVLIPLGGWMVARFGGRKVFLGAIVTFTFASFMCSTSVNLSELVAMRVLQGVGGAMMVPVGRLAVLAKAEKTDIMRLVAYIIWPGLIAPVIAPLAGGLITTYTSWRWLFLINIPLGICALIAAIRLMPTSPTTNPPRLDWSGVVLTCLGLGGVTYGAHLLSEPNATWTPIVTIIALSLIALGATTRHLLRTPDPLIDLQTIRVNTFRKSLVGGSLFGMSVGAIPFLLPLLFQNVFGWSPIRSGAVVLFIFVGNIGIKPATSFFLNRFGFRTILLSSTTGVAATMVLLGITTGATPVPIIALIAMVSGVFRSIGFTCYSTLAFSDIPESEMRHSNTLFATNQQLAFGLGIAFATVAIRVGSPLGNVFFAHPTKANAYSIAFCLLALVALLATASAFRLSADAGNAVRKVRAKSNA